jgi:CYTH domain-containing protein
MPALLVEVTPVWETATAVEATRIPAMLATEISAREATVAWDSATLRVKDAEDRATLVEREALERMSREEAENAMVLASAHEDVEGLV